jgi:hypothetical protein
MLPPTICVARDRKRAQSATQSHKRAVTAVTAPAEQLLHSESGPSQNRRAALAWTAEGGCPHLFSYA